MAKLNCSEIVKFDSKGMLDFILKFPQQLEDARNLSKEMSLDFDSSQISNICTTGMGGSGISGDIVRCYLADSLTIPLFVNRYYHLPNFVDESTLVVVSSYSGNTEETLSAYQDACRRKAKIVCITSGGELAEKAAANGHPICFIPAGYSPRAALGYLTVPLIYGLFSVGLITNPEADLTECINLLKKLSAEYHPDVEKNLPKKIGNALKGKIPLIYASVNGFEAVVWRWKGQLSENAEVLAFSNLFSELNHNEIMGWGPLTEINHHFQIIYLKDREYHGQIKSRMEITKEILEKHTSSIIEVESRGESLLARIFSLIFLGDLVSLYLAILNEVDPTPVTKIEYLKQQINLTLK